MTLRVDIRDLTVDIPVGGGRVLHAVRGVDIQLGEGEILCLVGESGCGKSMCAKATMGLLPGFMKVRASQATVAGTPLLSARAEELRQIRGDRIAMVFQEPMSSLHPTMRIGDQLVESFVLHGRGNRAAGMERAAKLLEEVGITAPRERLRQYAHELSGGMQQRVMIALALMCDPDIIIADEPTTALDVTIQAQILLLLKRLQQERGLSMIFITHDLGVVARIADRVAVMYAGKVVETGTAEAVFNAPSHPYTLGLLASIPGQGGPAAGRKLRAIPGTVPALVGDVRGCAFRNRCARATKACEQDPPVHERSAGHLVSCWNLGVADAAATNGDDAS